MSERQAKAVWCSNNRAKAWNDLMFRRIEPAASAECDTPIEELLEFGWRIGVRGTPTWFVESGDRFTGAVSRATLARLLDEVHAERRAKGGS